MLLTTESLNIYSKKLTELNQRNCSIKLGNLNTSLSIVDRTTREKISKEIKDLSNIIYQLDLTDIYRRLPNTVYSQ
jgi:hypothetical protein